jgi:hypothetical protein
VPLAVVSCYFNLNHSKYRLANYHAFRAALRTAGVASLTVEWSRDGASFELPADDSVLKITGGDYIWQTERLLNLGIERLPDRFDRVAWVDADIIFDQQDWPRRVEQALEQWPLVQMFSLARMLAEAGAGVEPSTLMEVPGSAWCHLREVKWPDGSERLGHCGYAWAARREVIQPVGLYDGAPVGGGDKNKLFALLGQLDQAQMAERQNPAMRAHYHHWAHRLRQACNGRFGYADLTLRHLWHGSLESRQYRPRHAIPLKHDYDPERDIRLSPGGVWQWNSDKPGLHREVQAYLTSFGE